MRFVSQRLDLSRGLRSTVGDDFLEDAQARLDLGVAGRILRRFFHREARFDVQLLFLEPEPAREQEAKDDDRNADYDEGDQDVGWAVHHFFPPSTSDSESISRASRCGWSVTIRSIFSRRSLSEPSSARSWAFSVVRSLIR